MSQTENKCNQEFTTINLYLGYKENPLEFDNFVAKNISLSCWLLVENSVFDRSN